MVQVGYSEQILLDRSVEKNACALLDAGADFVELFMDASGWDRLGENYGETARHLRRLGAAFHVHPAAWDVNLSAEMGFLRQACYEHYLRALDFCAELGAQQMVVHPGQCSFNKKNARQRAFETVCRLADAAAPLGVRLAFENVGLQGNSLYTQQEFCRALKDVPAGVGYLLDIGHAHVNGWNVPETLCALDKRLLGVHLHDNHGTSDEHLPIGAGTVAWPAVWHALRLYPPLSMEYTLEYAPGTPLSRLCADRTLVLAQLAGPAAGTA